ncbi:MAG: ribonucleotide reductase N-terminal alpha domain-containing protein [Gammaproteobacteria bacterium]
MSTAADALTEDARIVAQPAALDIWDKKYRLKDRQGVPIDRNVDDTWRRIARALAEVESTPALREKWYERFFWALRHGAIPAGRITSNAGAEQYKPSTSTINCTVSGTIHDSMDDILSKVHEAGLTLKAGCGIGYDFSTLRPRGARHRGRGHYLRSVVVHGHLRPHAFTVSSAGSRRSTDGDLRHQSPGCPRLHTRQARA